MGPRVRGEVRFVIVEVGPEQFQFIFIFRLRDFVKVNPFLLTLNPVSLSGPREAIHASFLPSDPQNTLSLFSSRYTGATLGEETRISLNCRILLTYRYTYVLCFLYHCRRRETFTCPSLFRLPERLTWIFKTNNCCSNWDHLPEVSISYFGFSSLLLLFFFLFFLSTVWQNFWVTMITSKTLDRSRLTWSESQCH